MTESKDTVKFILDAVTAFSNWSDSTDPAKKKVADAAYARTEEAALKAGAAVGAKWGKKVGEGLRKLTADAITDDDRREIRDKLVAKLPFTQEEVLKLYEETFPTNSAGSFRGAPAFDADAELRSRIVPDLEVWSQVAGAAEFVEHSTIELIDAAASDGAVVQGARVSTQGADASDEESAGLINFLMRDRHGSPFEHAWFKFRVTAPIVVWREHMRHRIASYNEQSGRYMKLEPVFHVPPEGRPLVQQGKPGAYTFVSGTFEQYNFAVQSLRRASIFGYMEYERQLAQGIAREVAREALTLNTMSTAIVSMNARALMNFISLRTKSEDAKVPSFPQYEIEEVGLGYEGAFKQLMPLTHAAFVKNGRVAP